ncbi:DUF882 domain-containing protein [Salinarimonas soli]|uniref:Murein endopeptidase K n=1 Tax=Salinarimonas soli TaxID=1638099 RepID=A0A5B2VZE0_9HYPH|nr:DUF882 domain-containing protein [Salinarimonas soli]KAA2244038.1 DUF882 domain-containing protein [Salinarimonas soli]
MRNTGRRRGTGLVPGRLTILGIAAAVAAPLLCSQAPALPGDDTRTLTFVHTHTNETATVTFRRNGNYDQAALDQVNWLLRDWRVNEPTTMDPRLLDIMWQARRETGSTGPVHIISAYRSPGTNAALRHRSKAVSEHSQHMAGKAMDIRLPDVPSARLREAAMRLQAGGVGFYPGSDFVHVDTGGVRAWPRMSRDQLVRLFPDGKTVHLPSRGAPLPGYELARAEILARDAAAPSGSTQVAAAGQNLWAALFGRTPGAGSEPAVVDRAAASSQPETGSPGEAAPPLPPARPRTLGVLTTASITPVGAEPPSRSVEEPSPAEADALRAFFSPALAARPERARIHYAQARPRGLDEPGLALDGAGMLDVRFTPDGRRDLGYGRFIGPAVRPLPVPTVAKDGLPG